MPAGTKKRVVIDPRPHPAPPQGKLAPRHRSLDGMRVLLFDNGKLHPSYGHYRAVFDVVEQELKQRWPKIELIHRAQNLLIGDLDRLRQTANEIIDTGANAVVFALCDTGVSQPNTILAAELETRGIPTSLICQGIGLRVAASTAAQLIPGLPFSSIDAIRIATYEQGASEASAIVRDVVGGLIESEAALIDRARSYPVVMIVPGDVRGFVELGSDDADGEFTELMSKSGLGDGLPLLAPYPERVEEMLRGAGVDGGAIVWPPTPSRTTALTARDVAIVAVAAGCRPQAMPVVLTAYRAMSDPRFRLFQAAITTHPSGTLVLVSGPATKELGLASGAGCLGSGFPANATIGRAVSLAYSFCLGVRLGSSDLSIQGSPAEYSYCCAENIDESPWPGLHAELLGPDVTSVTVLKCEGPHNVMDNLSMTPESLLLTVSSTASTLGSNNTYNPNAQTVVFLNPEHAAIIAAAGWSKSDVKRFLFDVTRQERARLNGRGSVPKWPAWFGGLPRTPIAETADDILVVVAGGHGPQSQVAIPWGLSRGITLPLHPYPDRR